MIAAAVARVIGPFSVPCLLLGLLFFAASLTPSLIPRGPVVQGILGGLVTALGYLAGQIVGLLWRAADSIWRAMGDKSTDGNWYSKRATLSGVIGSTFAVFLEDQDPEMAETRAFLDRRIGNVMEFEKAKANFRRFKSALPDPLKTLSKLRYGGVKRYN